MIKMFFIFLFINDFSLSITQAGSDDTIFIASWNLENLFDTADDPGNEDEEFTPSGEKEWTEDKLRKKLYKLAAAIRSMNDGKGPDILGVCETEHQYLLDTMIRNYLHDFNYKTAYAESPDLRGIDNGLIYNAEKFILLHVSADTINLPDGEQTRLILNVNLKSQNNDTLIIFVNHWPSRRTGEENSEGKRLNAAEVLKKRVNSLLTKNSGLKIIILGDFNDEPDNISVRDILNANPLMCGSISEFKSSGLYNLSYSKYKSGEGTYKYKDEWNMLDQIIVSGSLVNESGAEILCGTFNIYKPYFLQTHSGKYEGTPFPTYGGSRYLGGCSDHYPVTAQFILKENQND